MHAVAYILNAMRIFYYKIHYPQAFYASALNRYGITNTSNNTFDYLGFYNNTKNVDDLKRFHSHANHSSDNDVKVKNNIHIANVVWELKLRGFEIVPPQFSSKADVCYPHATDKKKILMPLASISGVGIETAKTIELAYKKYGDSLNSMSREQIEELRVEKDGKDIKAFPKKFLDGYFGE